MTVPPKYYSHLPSMFQEAGLMHPTRCRSSPEYGSWFGKNSSCASIPTCTDETLTFCLSSMSMSIAFKVSFWPPRALVSSSVQQTHTRARENAESSSPFAVSDFVCLRNLSKPFLATTVDFASDSALTDFDQPAALQHGLEREPEPSACQTAHHSCLHSTWSRTCSSLLSSSLLFSLPPLPSPLSFCGRTGCCHTAFVLLTWYRRQGSDYARYWWGRRGSCRDSPGKVEQRWTRARWLCGETLMHACRWLMRMRLYATHNLSPVGPWANVMYALSTGEKSHVWGVPFTSPVGYSGSHRLWTKSNYNKVKTKHILLTTTSTWQLIYGYSRTFSLPFNWVWQRVSLCLFTQFLTSLLA